MLRTTAPDCWSAGIGGSGEWRGPPATGEARDTVDYRPCLGPFSPGDPATRRRPRAGDTELSPRHGHTGSPSNGPVRPRPSIRSCRT